MTCGVWRMWIVRFDMKVWPSTPTGVWRCSPGPGGVPQSARSSPAQKPRPAPVITTTLHSGSVATSSSASWSSATSPKSMALSRSGRFSRSSVMWASIGSNSIRAMCEPSCVFSSPIVIADSARHRRLEARGHLPAVAQEVRSLEAHGRSMFDVTLVGSHAPRLVVMGRQGAGKGTQAERIAGRFGVACLSTGEVLRAAIEAGTPMSRLADPFVRRGELVPDDIVLDRVVEWTTREEVITSGFVLDGVPRTVDQAVALWGAGVGPFDAVVEIDVSLRVAVDRLARRGR